MVKYKKAKSANTWFVGVIVFIMAMTITFADVYGLNHFDFNKPSQTGNTSSNDGSNTDGSWQINPNTAEDPFPESPIPTTSPEPNPAIPEPGTLILLSLGIGALAARKRKK